VLVGKQLSHIEKEEVRAPPRIRSYVPAGYGRGVPVVEAGVTVTLDIEEFQYAYKCKHCGHEWSEKHTEKHLDPDQES
jgi:hypothetical protein